MRSVLMTLAAAGCVALGAASAAAAPRLSLTPSAPALTSPDITTVAQGCGPGAWRGPWGHCRDTPYSGPLPGGGWVDRAPPAYGFFGNGCPPGFWRGPWGHCRDTPYHGPLPDGGYKP